MHPHLTRHIRLGHTEVIPHEFEPLDAHFRLLAHYQAMLRYAQGFVMPIQADMARPGWLLQDQANLASPKAIAAFDTPQRNFSSDSTAQFRHACLEVPAGTLRRTYRVAAAAHSRVG